MGKSPKTNALGPTTAQLTVNVQKTLKASLKELAAESGVSFSVYVRGVLIQAVRRKSVVRNPGPMVEEQTTATALDAARKAIEQDLGEKAKREKS